MAVQLGTGGDAAACAHGRDAGTAESAAGAPRSAAAEEVIRLEGVHKFYGSYRAVEDVSLSVRRGEILTLLGPSGCGKTTTLRIAIGLERSSKGRVWFGEKLVDGRDDRVFVPPEKRNMGMVFQSYAIWPHMTVFENVAYPLKVRRRNADEVRREVMKVLDLVGLTGFEQRPGTMLSGGQMQRVAVARGLVFGPDLLLMDEPFSNLDAKLRDQMRGEIKLLQRRLGIAVLFVTHDQVEALSLSDRIAVMRAGQVEQVGSPEELYCTPRTSAVRDFLGRTVLLRGLIRQRGAEGVVIDLDEGARIQVGGWDHTGGTPAGSACIAAVRPEQIRVEPATPDAGPVVNAVPGRLLTLLFLGDRIEASVGLPSGAIVSVYLSAAARWSEGQAVALHLAPDQVQLWQPEGPQ